MENFLKTLAVVLRHITPLKTFLLILLIFSLIGGVAVWENRQMLYVTSLDGLGYRDLNPELVLTHKSKSQLDVLVQNRPYIISAAAIGINIQLNKRYTVYKYFSDKDLELKVRTIDAKEGAEVPLFTSDEAQNKQILSLLQGEFSCGKVVTTGIDARYKDAMAGKGVTSCRVPIPPAYGHLVGYIVFLLDRNPTEAELDELRTEAYTLSMNIYNELLKTAGPVRRLN